MLPQTLCLPWNLRELRLGFAAWVRFGEGSRQGAGQRLTWRRGLMNPLFGFSLSASTGCCGLCQSTLQGPESTENKGFEEFVVLILRRRAFTAAGN